MRHRFVTVFAVALAPIVVLAAGCESILGIPSEVTHTSADASSTTADGPEPSSEGGPAPMCNSSEETDVCFKCTDDNCCAEYTACHDDQRCQYYYKTCLPNCEHDGGAYAACVVACDSNNHGGHAVFAPFNACATRHCSGPCVGKLDACTACAYASCADVTTACRGDATCDTMLNCITDCPQDATHDACVKRCEDTTQSDSKTRLDAMFACWATYCQEPCQPP